MIPIFIQAENIEKLEINQQNLLAEW